MAECGRAEKAISLWPTPILFPPRSVPPCKDVCEHLTTSSIHNPSDLAFTHPLAVHWPRGAGVDSLACSWKHGHRHRQWMWDWGV